MALDDEQQPSPRLDVMLALNAKQQPADDSSAATGNRVAISHASPRMPGFSGCATLLSWEFMPWRCHIWERVAEQSVAPTQRLR